MLGQLMRIVLEIASATFGFCHEFIADQGLAFRGDDENVGSPRNFFEKIFQTFFQQIFKKKKMRCFW